MAFIPLAKLHQLADGFSTTVRVRGRQLMLIHADGQSWIIDSCCPHAGASLVKGRVAGGCIRCPKHGIEFDLGSGAPLGGEVVAGVAPLVRYRPVVEGDEIGLYLD